MKSTPGEEGACRSRRLARSALVLAVFVLTLVTIVFVVLVVFVIFVIFVVLVVFVVFVVLVVLVVFVVLLTAHADTSFNKVADAASALRGSYGARLGIAGDRVMSLHMIKRRHELTQ
jgi:ABC-type multidrug transport system fused ATPase/permease subunit